MRALPTLALLAFTSAAATAVAGVAHAQVCVAVDTSRDALGEQERRSAATLLAQALADQGQQVVATGCTGTFYVYHLRFGQAVTVHISGPPGARQATASRLEEVPPVYDQLVRSLLSGRPLSSSSNAVTRDNVTTAQTAPNRVGADSLWYLRLGPGMVAGSGLGTGPSFGFGYRYELDSIGIDASFLNFTMPKNDNSTGGGASGSLIRLMGLYFLNPVSNHTPYAGAGISYGMGTVADADRRYTGNGLQAELSVGYELLRASTIRIFSEFGATLPFYTVKSSDYSSTGPVARDSRYAPSFVLSFGVGWGRSRSILVRSI